MGIIDFIGASLGLVRIVPVNEAHVRILLDNREVFMCADGKKSKYWFIPFITKIHKLPLTNIRIDVPDVKLNDKNMAKFSCDVVCFAHISNPMLAAERTSLTVEEAYYEEGIRSLADDFRAIMESIARTVTTKQSILEIYMDRTSLDSAVSKEVQAVFPRWGLELVDLEVKEIRDLKDSTIIEDIESKIASQINADARVKIAEETKRAEIAEAENKKAAELIKAKNEEEWRKRQIEKDRQIGVSEQEKAKMIAEAEKVANVQSIEAKKALDVGRAEIDKQTKIINADAEKQAVIIRANADKEKVILAATAEAERIKATGTQEANIIKAKKVADAEGTEKLAVAQTKFNEAATSIELIKANKEIQMAYAKAYEEGLKVAKINVVSGSTQELMSGGILGKINVGPKEGIAVQQFLDSMDAKTKKQAEELFRKLTKNDVA